MEIDLTLYQERPNKAYAISDMGAMGKVRSGSDGKVIWQIGALAPKADRVVELRCVLKSPGTNRLEVFAQASADLTDSSVTTADVVGVPDLTLEMRDAAGPVLVGRETTYEIRIHNRGTKRADGPSHATNNRTTPRSDETHERRRGRRSEGPADGRAPARPEAH